MEPIDLNKIYAQYFVEDFTTKVMSLLKGSYNVDPTLLSNFIKSKVNFVFGQNIPFTLSAVNSITRFIFECVEYAQESGFVDPETRIVWDDVSNRPSLHHDEIQALIYSLAEVYHRMINDTILGIIVRDAQTASKTITQVVQSRISTTETGGAIHLFSWGILNDGLWLNGALIKAFELASIFAPGEPIAPYYSESAFNFASQKATLPYLNEEAQTSAYGELDLLISQVNNPEELSDLFKDFSQSELNGILFISGRLYDCVKTCVDGSKLPSTVIKSIKHLSVITRIVGILNETARYMEDQTLISDLVRSRLNTLNDVITLLLVGYEALRETKFAETLILDVGVTSDDPKVDVIVNNDMLNNYHAAGGEESDLVSFGHYLDPRKGITTPGNGWSLSWVMARRMDVVPTVMAETTERLEKMRSNDAAVIQAEAVRIIGNLVNSCAEAADKMPLRPDITQSIYGLSRKLSSSSDEGDVTKEIVTILITTIDDPHVTKMANSLMANLSSSDNFVKTNSVALAIAESAIDDSYTYLTVE